MADSEVVLDVETLAERLAWARGTELLGTLEELEAVTARRPDLAGLSLPALIKLLEEPATAGAEATQQAIEVVARLVSPPSDAGLAPATRAALEANGQRLVSNVANVAVFLDVLESDACETYTAVIILELLGALARAQPVALRHALLAAPAGSARLVDLLDDDREELRNASVTLWERLSRPGQTPGKDAEADFEADELRRCCAFNDGFSKIFNIVEQEASSTAVVRDAACLAANVLAGPGVALTCLQHAAPEGGLQPFGSLLTLKRDEVDDSETSDDVEAMEEEDRIGDESDALRQQKQQRVAKRSDAFRCAAAALAALRRYLVGGNDSDSDALSKSDDADDARRFNAVVDQRHLRQATLWKCQGVRDALFALCFEDSEFDPDATFFAEEWWAELPHANPTRADLRCAALSVLTQLMEEHEGNALNMTEHRVQLAQRSPPQSAQRPLAARLLLRLATRGNAEVARVAATAAAALWKSEAAAIVMVMHAVAPPPNDDEMDDAISALSALAEAVADKGTSSAERPRRALRLLRGLVSTSASVRELALRLPSHSTGLRDDDAPADVFGAVLCDSVRKCGANDATPAETDAVLGEALALVCTWLQGCGAAAHALLSDPDDAAAMTFIAKSSSAKRNRGLACVALGLCLEHVGAVANSRNNSAWTRDAVHALVERRVGLGAFTRTLVALQEDALKKRRGAQQGDVFADEAFAAFVAGAAGTARALVVGGMMTSSSSDVSAADKEMDAAAPDPQQAARLAELEAQVLSLEADRETLSEVLEGQALELSRLNKEATAASSAAAASSSVAASAGAATISAATASADAAAAQLRIAELEASLQEALRQAATEQQAAQIAPEKAADDASSAKIAELEAALREAQAAPASDDKVRALEAEARLEASQLKISDLEAALREAAERPASDEGTRLLQNRVAELEVAYASARLQLEARPYADALPAVPSDDGAVAALEAQVERLEAASNAADARSIADQERHAADVARVEALHEARRNDATAELEAEVARLQRVAERLAEERRIETEAAAAVETADADADSNAALAQAEQRALDAEAARDAAEAECDSAVDELALLQDRLFSAEAAGKGTDEGVVSTLKERVAELEAGGSGPSAGLAKRCADLEARCNAAEEVRQMMEQMKNDAMTYALEVESKLRLAAEELEEVKEEQTSKLRDVADAADTDLSDQFEALEEERGRLRADLEGKTAALQVSEKQSSAFEAAALEAEIAQAKLQNVVDEFVAKGAAMPDDADAALREALASAQADVEALQSGAGAARAALEAAQSALEAAEARGRELVQQNAALEAANVELGESKLELEEARLELELAADAGADDAARAAADRAAADVAALRADLEAAEGRARDLLEQNAALEAANVELEEAKLELELAADAGLDGSDSARAAELSAVRAELESARLRLVEADEEALKVAALAADLEAVRSQLEAAALQGDAFTAAAAEASQRLDSVLVENAALSAEKEVISGEKAAVAAELASRKLVDVSAPAAQQRHDAEVEDRLRLALQQAEAQRDGALDRLAEAASDRDRAAADEAAASAGRDVEAAHLAELEASKCASEQRCASLAAELETLVAEKVDLVSTLEQQRNRLELESAETVSAAEQRENDAAERAADEGRQVEADFEERVRTATAAFEQRFQAAAAERDGAASTSAAQELELSSLRSAAFEAAGAAAALERELSALRKVAADADAEADAEELHSERLSSERAALEERLHLAEAAGAEAVARCVGLEAELVAIRSEAQGSDAEAMRLYSERMASERFALEGACEERLTAAALDREELEKRSVALEAELAAVRSVDEGSNAEARRLFSERTANERVALAASFAERSASIGAERDEAAEHLSALEVKLEAAQSDAGLRSERDALALKIAKMEADEVSAAAARKRKRREALAKAEADASERMAEERQLFEAEFEERWSAVTMERDDAASRFFALESELAAVRSAVLEKDAEASRLNSERVASERLALEASFAEKSAALEAERDEAADHFTTLDSELAAVRLEALEAVALADASAQAERLYAARMAGERAALETAFAERAAALEADRDALQVERDGLKRSLAALEASPDESGRANAEKRCAERLAAVQTLEALAAAEADRDAARDALQKVQSALASDESGAALTLERDALVAKISRMEADQVAAAQERKKKRREALADAEKRSAAGEARAVEAQKAAEAERDEALSVKALVEADLATVTSTLGTELASAKSASAALEGELKEQLGEVEADNERHLSSIGELEAENRRLGNDVDELSQSKVELAALMDEQRATLEAFDESKERERATFMEDHAALVSANAALVSTNAALAQSLEDQRALEASASASLNTSRQKCISLEEDMLAAERASRDAVETLVMQRAALEKCSAEAVETLEASAASAEASAADQMSRLEAALAENAALEASVEELKSEAISASQAEGRASELQGRLAALQAFLEAQGASSQGAERVAVSLEALEGAEARVSALVFENAALLDDKAALESELAERMAQAFDKDDVSVLVSELESEVSELESEVEVLRFQKDELLIALDASTIATERCIELEEQGDDLQLRLEAARADVDDSRVEVVQAQEAAATERLAANEFRGMVEAAKMEIASLEAARIEEVDALKKCVEQLSAALAARDALRGAEPSAISDDAAALRSERDALALQLEKISADEVSKAADRKTKRQEALAKVRGEHEKQQAALQGDLDAAAADVAQLQERQSVLEADVAAALSDRDAALDSASEAAEQLRAAECRVSDVDLAAVGAEEKAEARCALAEAALLDGEAALKAAVLEGESAVAKASAARKESRAACEKLDEALAQQGAAAAEAQQSAEALAKSGQALAQAKADEARAFTALRAATELHAAERSGFSAKLASAEADREDLAEELDATREELESTRALWEDQGGSLPGDEGRLERLEKRLGDAAGAEASFKLQVEAARAREKELQVAVSQLGRELFDRSVEADEAEASLRLEASEAESRERELGVVVQRLRGELQDQRLRKELQDQSADPAEEAKSERLRFERESAEQAESLRATNGDLLAKCEDLEARHDQLTRTNDQLRDKLHGGDDREGDRGNGDRGDRDDGNNDDEKWDDWDDADAPSNPAIVQVDSVALAAELERQNDDLEVRNSALERHVAHLEARLEARSADESISAAAESAAEALELESQLRRALLELDEVEMVRVGLDDELSLLEEKVAHLEESKDRLAEKVAHLEESNDRLAAENDRLAPTPKIRSRRGFEDAATDDSEASEASAFDDDAGPVSSTSRRRGGFQRGALQALEQRCSDLEESNLNLTKRLAEEEDRAAEAAFLEDEAEQRCLQVERRIAEIDLEAVAAEERASDAESRLGATATRLEAHVARVADLEGETLHVRVDLSAVRMELESEKAARADAEQERDESEAALWEGEVNEVHKDTDDDEDTHVLELEVELEDLRLALDDSTRELDAERHARRATELMLEERVRGAEVHDAGESGALVRRRAVLEDDLGAAKAALDDAKRVEEALRSAAANSAHQIAEQSQILKLRDAEVEELREALDETGRRAEEDALHADESDALWEEQHAELRLRTAEAGTLRDRLDQEVGRASALEASLARAQDELAETHKLLAESAELSLEQVGPRERWDSLEATQRVDTLDASTLDVGHRSDDDETVGQGMMIRGAPWSSAVEAAEARAAFLDSELRDARQFARELELTLTDSAPNAAHSELRRLTNDVRTETQLRMELQALRRERDALLLKESYAPDEPVTPRRDYEWRALDDEHNDLLALLAQQELEKHALRSFVTKTSGGAALETVRRAAKASCIERYGVYISYDDFAEDSPTERLDYDGEFDSGSEYVHPRD